MTELGISVIITAYNRKQFLPDAINSALHQTLDRYPFEIIVVSNFYVNVSHFDKSNKIRTFLMDGEMGEFLFAGLSKAKYNVVTFMDDDDTFDQGKFSRIMEVFISNPELCYYHNGVSYVDYVNRRIDYARLVEKRYRSINNKCLILNPKSSTKAIRSALDNSGDFNLSSISIRKECYLKYLIILNKIKSNPEGFFFWAGIISMGQLMIDGLKLTNYRVHETTESGPLNFKSKAKVVSRQIYTYDLILNFIDSNPTKYKTTKEIKKWIYLIKYEYELLLSIFNGSSRFSILLQMGRLLTIGKGYSNTLKYRIMLFSCIAIVKRSLAQIFYQKMRMGTAKH